VNKVELQNRLISENIRSDVYSLKGGLPNEAFCLAEINGQWEVYYSERGNKTGLRTFTNEEEACQYFYNQLLRTLKSMGLL
jgi:hypothetical protein